MCPTFPLATSLKMEDFLQSIFRYLDTDSIKQCRLVDSSWNRLVTPFLMKRTFCTLPSAEYLLSKPSLTSVKIKEPLLSQLCSKMLHSFPPTHWKSVFVSLVPTASGISNLTSFLTSISSGHCPQLTHLKIHFGTDEYHQMVNGLEKIGAFNLGINLRIDVSNPIPENGPLKFVSPIRSLCLCFDDGTNRPQVSAFLKLFIKKEVVPDLKQIVAEFPEAKWRLEKTNDLNFSQAYKTMVETLAECGDVLSSLKVLKIQANVPLGVSKFSSPVEEKFLYNARMRDFPQATVSLNLSSEIEELQLGSGLLALRGKDDVDLPQFLPGILTPSVASVLQTLDLSGFYISEGSQLIFPCVNFPSMPCLRKLTAEEIAVGWIKNFDTIFQKAQGIREYRMKNSWAQWKSGSCLEAKNAIDFKKWEETWGSGGYPSLTRLEFGASIDVKNSVALDMINRAFPNIEVLQFSCDDKSQRLRRNNQPSCCAMEFMDLPGIVEGLGGWKSLRQLKVTFWPAFSVSELLDHFVDFALKIPSLRLYDFKRMDDANPTLSLSELRNNSFLNRMKEKMIQLKAFPQLVFVLHDFHCPNGPHVDAKASRFRKCSVMEELFQFAETNEIFNFRHGTKE